MVGSWSFSGYRVGSTKSSNPLIFTLLWPLSSSFDLQIFQICLFFFSVQHLPRSQFDSSKMNFLQTHRGCQYILPHPIKLTRPKEINPGNFGSFEISKLELPIKNHPPSGKWAIQLGLKSAKKTLGHVPLQPGAVEDWSLWESWNGMNGSWTRWLTWSDTCDVILYDLKKGLMHSMYYTTIWCWYFWCIFETFLSLLIFYQRLSGWRQASPP